MRGVSVGISSAIESERNVAVRLEVRWRIRVGDPQVARARSEVGLSTPLALRQEEGESPFGGIEEPRDLVLEDRQLDAGLYHLMNGGFVGTANVTRALL